MLTKTKRRQPGVCIKCKCKRRWKLWYLGWLVVISKGEIETEMVECMHAADR